MYYTTDTVGDDQKETRQLSLDKRTESFSRTWRNELAAFVSITDAVLSFHQISIIRYEIVLDNKLVKVIYKILIQSIQSILQFSLKWSQNHLYNVFNLSQNDLEVISEISLIYPTQLSSKLSQNYLFKYLQLIPKWSWSYLQNIFNLFNTDIFKIVSKSSFSMS